MYHPELLNEFPRGFPEELIRTGEAASEHEYVFWRDFVNELSKFFMEPVPQHPLFRTTIDWRSKFYADRDLGFFRFWEHCLDPFLHQKNKKT